MGSKAGTRQPSLAKVIDLAAYRHFSSRAPKTPVLFYLSQGGELFETLERVPWANITDIRSSLSFHRSVLIESPDLFLVESELNWMDPVQVISEIHSKMATPVILLCGERKKTDQGFLKRAFAAGLHDTLFRPLIRDELDETLSVLIKMRKQVLEG